MPDLNHVKAAVEALSKAFEAYKAANDEALKELSKQCACDPLLGLKVERLAAEVVEKSAAVERIGSEADDRMNRLEAALNRSGRGGEVANIHRKDAYDMRKATALTYGRPLDFGPGDVDMGEYHVYRGALGVYLRRGKDGLGQDEVKALSAGSEPDGGYWVTPEMSNRIVKTVFESSPIRELATVETIGGAALEIVVDDDEPGFGWVAETATRTETTSPTIRKKEIVAHELYAEPRTTQRVLEDAGFNVDEWLAGKVADKFARAEATAFVAGTGAGQPRGFMTYAAGTSYGQIEQINSGSASDVTFDGLISLTGALKSFYKRNATFLIKRSSLTNVMKLKDVDGQYLWRPNLEAGRPATLLGYPVREAEDIAAIAGNALAVAFGDFRAGYTIVERMGVRVLRDPFTAKPFVKFYTTRRVGGDVVNFEAIKIQKIAA